MALQQSLFLTPRNSTIDVTENNDFTAQVNGSAITAYQIVVLPIMGGAPVYDTGQVPLVPSLTNGDTLTVEVPANSGTLANGNEYSWTIETFDSSSSIVSDPVAFFANTNPVITFSVPPVITTASFTFTPVYTQAENIDIEFSYFEFRDSNGDLILRTPDNFTGDLSFEFTGFLNGESYQVQFFGRNQRQVNFQSSLLTFDVVYPAPNINIQPTISQDNITSFINVAWGQVVVIIGTPTGSFSYIQNYLIENNVALDLETASTVSWVTDIPSTFTGITRWQKKPLEDPTIIISHPTSMGEFYTIGYGNGRWNFNNKGVVGESEPIPLSENPLFIVVRDTDVVIWDQIDDIFTKIVIN